MVKFDTLGQCDAMDIIRFGESQLCLEKSLDELAFSHLYVVESNRIEYKWHHDKSAFTSRQTHNKC